MPKPFLSIGMIFKNEIRCIQRCLESLARLRAMLPCELVMADTGATDGSRAVAEQYADILFDFAWVDDFSAARNAVLDRCSGEWCLTIDCDEWLEDVGPFLRLFVMTEEATEWEAARITQRNYTSPDNPHAFIDVPVRRLFRRLDGKMRYEMPIHEIPYVQQEGESRTPTIIYCASAILHHDGYIDFEGSKSEKNARNMLLLEKELQKKPGDLRTLQEMVESARSAGEMFAFAKQTVEVLRLAKDIDRIEQASGYKAVIKAAQVAKEYETVCEWAAEAEEKIPDSVQLQLDGNALWASALANQNKYAEALKRGEEWRRALEKLDTGEWKERSEITLVQLETSNTLSRFQIGMVLLQCACKAQDWPQAQQWADLVAAVQPSPDDFAALLHCLLQAAPHIDAAGPLTMLWQSCAALTQGGDERERAIGRRCKSTMLQWFSVLLAPGGKQTEENVAAIRAVAGMGACDPARAARVLLTQDRAAVEVELARVERWADLPAPALGQAIALGAPLPQGFFAQPCEALAAAAEGAAQGREPFADAVLAYAPAEDYTDSLPRLLWLADLAAIAMQRADWSAPEQGVALCGLFAALEGDLLASLYNLPVIEEGDLPALPAAHRFGWRLTAGLQALAAGDAREYMRLARDGAEDVPAFKKAALFLLDNLDAMRPAPPPSPELLALAEQVRTILAQYPPDDPAVLRLKAGAAYQQVAALVENDLPAQT